MGISLSSSFLLFPEAQSPVGVIALYQQSSSCQLGLIAFVLSLKGCQQWRWTCVLPETLLLFFVFHICSFFCLLCFAQCHKSTGLSGLYPSCTFTIMAPQWDAPAGHNDSQSQILVKLGFQPTEVMSHIYRLLKTEATLVNKPRADLLMRKARLHMHSTLLLLLQQYWSTTTSLHLLVKPH